MSHSTEYFTKSNQKLPLQKYLSSDFDKNFINRPKQGFVFDYKSWVFQNKNMIYDVIESSELSKHLNTKNIMNLEKVPTRINGLRLWRMYVLAYYLKGIRDL
jgi:hypothetical protein